MSYDRIIAMPDLHEPYSDARAFAAAVSFVSDIRPARIVVLGDWIDMYQLSRFDKDPKRQLELQSDLDRTYESLRKVRRAAPKARIFYLKGNHEHRLIKYLWGTASPLASLRGLRLDELLRFKELGIEYCETGQTRMGPLAFIHGNIVRARSGYSATAELEKRWVSGISAHTHRLAQIYRSNDAGSFTWLEAGCLCDLEPSYMEGQVPDWTQGVVYCEMERRGNRFRAQPIPIVNGRIFWDGREIK